MSLEEVSMHASHEVLMEAYYNALIIGDPQGILDQQHKPRLIHSLNII